MLHILTNNFKFFVWTQLSCFVIITGTHHAANKLSTYDVRERGKVTGEESKQPLPSVRIQNEDGIPVYLVWWLCCRSVHHWSRCWIAHPPGTVKTKHKSTGIIEAHALVNFKSIIHVSEKSFLPWAFLFLLCTSAFLKSLWSAYIFNIFLLFVEGLAIEMHHSCSVDGFGQTTSAKQNEHLNIWEYMHALKKSLLN